MSVRQWFGIAGTNDGTATGTPSIAQIVSGVVSVVTTTGDALLTSIKTAVEKVATEVVVGDGLRVEQETASKLKCTEASASAIKTATEKVATEVGVATGLLVRQPTAASFNVTEASAAGILADTAAIETATVATQAATEKMDDWDAVHDSPAGADGCRQMLAAYADPSVLPADVSADGDDVRAVGSRKGVAYVSLPDNIEGEDATNHVMKVEGQFSNAYLVAEAQVKGSAGFIHSIHIVCTTAGTVTVYNSLTEAAPVVDQYIMAINTQFGDTLDVLCGTGIYVGFDATFAGSVRVSYR